MTATLIIVFCTAAYLLGSIPFGLLIARAHGKDLRSIGSGNIGATNVARALGRSWAYFCFTLDVLKGLIPMLAAKVFILNKIDSANTHTAGMLFLWLIVGCAAVIGHIFPIYLKLKGGKGVATSLGVVLGLYPYYTIPGLIALLVWAIVVLITRYVSLASIIAAVAMPVSLIIIIFINPDWHFNSLWPLFAAAIVMTALITLRHKENIKRLLKGTEHKIFQKKNDRSYSC